MWDNTAHHRSWWVAAAAAALVVIAVFVYGLVNMIGAAAHLLSHDTSKPDVLAQVDQHDKDAGLVALFSRYCTEVWAKSTPETLGQLQECVTVPATARNTSGTAATVSGIDVYPPQLTYKDSELSVWSVLVDATIKEFSAPSATREFIWWSVSLPRAAGPRAVLMPGVRATGLPAGVDMELGYTHDVRAGDPNACSGAGPDRKQGSPLYEVVKGFLGAYLCGAAGGDIRTYITADAELSTLGQLYSDVKIETMQSDAAADGPPEAGQQVRVLVTVTGKESSGGRKPMQYPLLVVDAAGRWAVAALEDLPVITGRMLPAGGN
ncbi:hypothetical protein E2F47_25040 [Mycobacterium eburneum]|nr:hypothetical protein [Mycobacterium eburneum]TDH48133.1 hypothetical protein E2F47_25040 [Mycobacterium eburneum]